MKESKEQCGKNSIIDERFQQQRLTALAYICLAHL
jgi:hypothetical protein